MPAKGDRKLEPEEIESKIKQYFAECDASRVDYITKAGIPMSKQIPYSMEGLQEALDNIHHSTYERWATGDYPGEHEEKDRVSAMLTRASAKVRRYTIEHAAMGEIDSKIATLLMSKWGYSSKAEIEHSGGFSVTWEGASGDDASKWSG